MKTVVFNSKIRDVLKDFISSSGETIYDSVIQSILDYVNILSHVCGDNPDNELVHIVNVFEIASQVIFKKMIETRLEFLRVRREESILLDKKLPHCDNANYVMIEIPNELHRKITTLINHNPNIFSSEKNATIKDVINRSILFRIMENDLLMENEIYRAWRLEMIMRKEKSSKLSIDEIIKIISRRRRVTWDE